MSFSRPNAEIWLAFKQSFQELWVAGTQGAFFAAFAKNLPMDIHQFYKDPDPFFAVDRLVRYGYLFWFLAYFFISNFNNKKQSKTARRTDILYDVAQSCSALLIAYFLGFVGPTGFSLKHAYAVTNGAVVLICGLSLCLFHGDPAPRGINALRIIGLLISGFSAGLAWKILPAQAMTRADLISPQCPMKPSTDTLLVFGALLLVLAILLAMYIVICLVGHTRILLINNRTKRDSVGSPVDISFVTGKTWELKLYPKKHLWPGDLTMVISGSSDSSDWKPLWNVSIVNRSPGDSPNSQFSLSDHPSIKFLKASWKFVPRFTEGPDCQFELSAEDVEAGGPPAMR